MFDGGMFGLGTGFDCYIMNSSEVADNVIKLYESAIEQGFAPTLEVQMQIFRQLGIDGSEISGPDRRRIEDTVSAIWESQKYRGRR